MSEQDEQTNQGTAPPARLEKAGCGVRFSEGELREGIDFTRASELKPADPDREADNDRPVSSE